MKPLISIQQGVARHPDRRMAEPVNLIINEGEQVAIVGENGAGKSRLIDIVTGRSPLLLNEVQYCFPQTDQKLVSENLRYITFRDSYGEQDGTYYYQKRWNQHDIDEDMPMVDGKPIVALSSGEMRRYQLSKALKTKPRVLIIDNPFIGLDQETRTWLAQLLQKFISEDGLCLVLVVSRPSDIPEFITHVIPVSNLKVGEKLTLKEYRESVGTTPSSSLSAENERRTKQLPAACEAWIRQLPEKDLSALPFYPQHGGPILDFRDVSIRYGERTILSHLNWTVCEGERWALSGANGSGKSTLLSLVCADNPQAYACNIALFGHKRGSGESIWEIKKHIGYVSPEMHRAYQKDIPAIDIVASGLNDTVGLYTRPRSEQRSICLRWMQVFGVEQLADRTFLKLSSGEQRLCLLARAFVKDPELLILDEPLHGLDERNRERAKEVIETFCERRNKTLVMVTHYEEELPRCIQKHLRLEKHPSAETQKRTSTHE